MMNQYDNILSRISFVYNLFNQNNELHTNYANKGLSTKLQIFLTVPFKSIFKNGSKIKYLW